MRARARAIAAARRDWTYDRDENEVACASAGLASARELLRARRESSTCAPRLRYTALVERSPCKPALDALLSDVDTPISPAERGAQRLLVGRSRSGEALAQAAISSAMNARRRLQPRLTVR